MLWQAWLCCVTFSSLHSLHITLCSSFFGDNICRISAASRERLKGQNVWIVLMQITDCFLLGTRRLLIGNIYLSTRIVIWIGPVLFRQACACSRLCLLETPYSRWANVCPIMFTHNSWLPCVPWGDFHIGTKSALTIIGGDPNSVTFVGMLPNNVSSLSSLDVLNLLCY